MANLGVLGVDLTLESAQFIAGMKRAAAQTEATGKSIQSAIGMAKTTLQGFAAAVAVDALVGAAKRAFDYADAIVDLSNQTGASTKSIQEFRYAAQMSGSSVENADASLAKFTKNLGSAQNGNQAMARAFRDLGVSARDPDEALRQFADGIAKLPNAAQRQSAAMSIMGKSAGDLAPLLSQGSRGFNDLAAAAQQMGTVIEDSVLQNAGQVNDRLDTMKMILDAQFANAIVSNADALMTLANSFIAAASAAGQFFSNMQNRALMNLSEGNVPLISRLTNWGKSGDQIGREAYETQMGSRSGRAYRFKEYTRRYNEAQRNGESPAELARLKGLRDENLTAELKARREERARLSVVRSGGVLPAPRIKTPHSKSHKSSGPPLRSDEELATQWRDRQREAGRDQDHANLALMVNPGERYDVQKQMLDRDLATRNDRIDADTGTDRELREGKKRLTKAQADELKATELATYWLEDRALTNERDADIARDRFDAARDNLSFEAEMLSAQGQLARSTAERRTNALALVKNQFAQQRLEAERIIELEKIGKATKAEREAAERRLANLPALEAVATEAAKRSTQTPLEEYLSQIPRTADEINDALSKVQVEGLQNLESGIFDMIKGTKSLGDAFKDVAGTIIDAMIKIIIQQALIKPLGDLLGGGEGGGGGGWLGSIFKIGVSAIPGASGGGISGGRANGGLTRPGLYEVGERGREIIAIGANANVTPNHALPRIGANDNRGGLTVRIDSITSNDPAMVRRMVYEGVAEATPLITQQATDRTMSRLRRGQM